MSFWKHNQCSSPQIDAILAKEDLTLNELFDQDCLFQELKSSNKALIDFISRNDVLAELVQLVTEEPSTSIDEKDRYKLANLACEVLTTDTPTINEKLSDKMHLSKLYSFLESDAPLNPLLASFFSRTLSMLICRKHDQHWYSYQYTCLQVLDFLKSQSKSLDLLVKHLGTSAIMELTLKLLTAVEGAEIQNTLINLLENECLIDNLMGLFDPSIDEDRHYNVSALLCETIYKAKDDLNNSAENGEKRRDTNPILDKIQSVMMVEKLLKNCFGENVSESSIVSGISVLLALLCPPPSTNLNRRGCDELASGSGDSLHAIGSQLNLLPILSTIMPFLPRLHQLLIEPPKREGIKLACGIVDPPLGQARLNIVKLLATLISTNTPEINAKLDELNTVQILLDLFFQYTWNNFLHAQVERCLALALNSSSNESAQSNPLLPNIFVKCRILEKILNAWEENEIEQSKGNRRRGYMGHLINIANNLDKQSEDENLRTFIRENVDSETLESWNTFITDTLIPINNQHKKCLGGQHPSQVSDDEEVNMKATFDMQEPLIKLQTSDDNMMSDDLRTNLQQADFSAIIENILPNFQDHLNFQEEDIFLKQFCSMKDSTWQNMPSLSNPPCNSSDEELEDDEDAVVGGPLLDGGNPWRGLDPGYDVNDTEGWANFDSNFSQGFASDPVYKPQNMAPLPQLAVPNLSDLESGVNSLVADDEDCNPPTEFEFEDSVEAEEDTFEPAVNSLESNTDYYEPIKEPIEPIKNPVALSNICEPTPGRTESCADKHQDANSNKETVAPSSEPQPLGTTSGQSVQPDNRQAQTPHQNIPNQPIINQSEDNAHSTSRLAEKAGATEITGSAKTVVTDVDKEKENKVPENSDNGVAGEVKSQEKDKKVEDAV